MLAERLDRVVLASGSLRRGELLDNLGLSYSTVSPDIDETPGAGEPPVDYVRRLAAEKAMAVAVGPHDLVLAADTTIDVDGAIVGKPDDEDDARRILRSLSGRTHAVHTGLAVRLGERIETYVGSTLVEMVPISEPLLEWYVATGEPLGKAGAYGIQGAAAALVAGVHGSVSNVIGLPVAMLDPLLGRFGLSLTDLPRA